MADWRKKKTDRTNALENKETFQESLPRQQCFVEVKKSITFFWQKSHIITIIYDYFYFPKTV